MDRQVAMKTWDALANAIDEIYNRNASQLSFEELYRNAYNLVLHKHGTLLYEGVSEKLNSHLNDTVNKLAETPESSLLEEMSTTWSEHQVRCIEDRLKFEYYSLSRRCELFLLTFSALMTYANLTCWCTALLPCRLP